MKIPQGGGCGGGGNKRNEYDWTLLAVNESLTVKDIENSWRQSAKTSTTSVLCLN